VCCVSSLNDETVTSLWRKFTRTLTARNLTSVRNTVVLHSLFQIVQKRFTAWRTCRWKELGQMFQHQKNLNFLFVFFLRCFDMLLWLNVTWTVIYFVILYQHLYILLYTVLSFTVTCTVTVLYFVVLPTSHCYFGQTMNLTVLGLLVAYGVDSSAVMAASVFMTIGILWLKWSGPKVVMSSGVYCSSL